MHIQYLARGHGLIIASDKTVREVIQHQSQQGLVLHELPALCGRVVFDDIEIPLALQHIVEDEVAHLVVHDGVLPDKLYAAVSVPPLRLEKHPAELLVVLRPFRFAVSIERRTDDVLAQKCQRVKILLLDIGVVALFRLCFVAFDRGELLCRDIFDDAQIAPDFPAVLKHGISLGEAHIQTALLRRFDEIPDVVELVDHGAKQLIDLLAVKELAQQIKHLDKIVRPFCRQHKIAFLYDLGDKPRDR